MSTKRKPHKNTNNRSAKIAVIAVILALLAIIGVSAGALLLHKPGQTEHTLPSVTTEPPVTEETQDGPGQTEPPETEAPRVNSRKEDHYNFLVLGKDSAGLNTDVIMIISYDVKEAQVSLMQIPRDTYIELNGHGYKINAVYASLYNKAYREGSKEPKKDGLAAFAKVLSENLCVPIDYYALMDLRGFRNIVDIFGGVEINVPADMEYYDPTQNLTINIKKGRQVLDGRTAEGFVRFRSGYATADIGRIDAQKLFMSAFLAQIKEEISLDKIPALMDEVFKNVTTSISVADCVYFARKVLGDVDLSNIKMATLPGEAIRENNTYGTWYYTIYRHDTLALINESFCAFEYPIEDGQFDINHAFNQEDNEYFSDIYGKDTGKSSDGYVSSADDIQDGAIHIPRLPDKPATQAPATEPETEGVTVGETSDETAGESAGETAGEGGEGAETTGTAETTGATETTGAAETEPESEELPWYAQ